MTNKAVQFVQLLRSSKREKRLGTVILFITSRCNALCQTCFYHAELNQPGDLTFAQLEKISETMPPITDLWLSGGEPTLRGDISHVIDLFVRNNGVDRIIIPTNGLIKSRVFEIVDRALGNNPGVDLYLNVALDGYGETHDRIRGVPGNWQKTLDCIESLYPLKSKYTDRFRLNVNTVVCAANYTEIEMLSEFMWQNYKLDGQYFNIIRGETLAGDHIKQVPPEVLPAMYAHAAKLTKRYGDRRRQVVLVYARLFHSRLDAPLAPGALVRRAEELSHARELVKCRSLRNRKKIARPVSRTRPASRSLPRLQLLRASDGCSINGWERSRGASWAGSSLGLPPACLSLFV
jgi:sulfatase maturation enzyme AslB (radical SAM superfamily)